MKNIKNNIIRGGSKSLIKLIMLVSIIIAVAIGTSAMAINSEKIEKVLGISQEKLTEQQQLEEQQELRAIMKDKMKIESVDIVSRETGTGPFTEGEGTPQPGEDFGVDDDYVRTLDIVKYNISAVIGANTDDLQSVKGGVLKVRAKLPNQGTEVNMKWEQDAWMQNVEITDDGTTIYAEYNLPENSELSQGSQTLSFTYRIGGYVVDVTEEMMPEFEVWMDGNKPDDETSEAESVIVKDTENKLYISGKPAFNIKLAKGEINYKGEYQGEVGQYTAYGIMIGLNQDIDNISDLRGLEYPKGDFSVDLKLEYSYKEYNNPNSNWQSLGTNNTRMVAYDLNGKSNNNFWPHKGIEVKDLPRYKGSTIYSVTDSGTMKAVQNDDIITVTFNNFILDNNHWPTNNINNQSNVSRTSYTSKEGYFSVGQIEMFSPYYDYDNPNIEYQYQLSIKAKEATYNTSNAENLRIESNSNDMIQDINTSDNVLNFLMQKDVRGSFTGHLTFTYNDKQLATYPNGDSYIQNDKEVVARSLFLIYDGPYEGGSDRIITWNSKFLTPLKVAQYATTDGIVDTPSEENLQYKWGVYKQDEINGITDDAIVDSAEYDDFTWYDTKEEAEEGGRKVSSIYVNDPDHIGYRTYRYIYVRFSINQDEENLGKVTFVRHKINAYADKERTRKYKYTTTYENYIPTEYNEDGTIKNQHSVVQRGNSLLIIPYHTTINMSVADTTSNGDLKKSYDVNDGVVNFKITPKLSNEKTAQDSDGTVDKVTVTNYLPKGLTYKEGSANKEPSSITVDASTGETKIVWEYYNWQVNREAPEVPVITYQAEIDASLENNTQLENKVIIYTELDKSRIATRTSTYGISISNLAGIQAIKDIDKTIIDIDQTANVTTSTNNMGKATLKDVRMLEILPYNGDSKGSNFTGGYRIKTKEIPEGQSIYYTTLPENQLETIGGVGRDKYEKLNPSTIDLETNSNWVKANSGETLPEGVTAIVTTFDEIAPNEKLGSTYEIITQGNSQGDEYCMNANISAEGFVAVLKSNTVILNVVKRSIEGTVWEDTNKDGIMQEDENKLQGVTVEIVDSNGNEVNDAKGNKIGSQTTDESGKYSFTNLAQGTYKIKYTVNNQYKVTTKNVGTDETVNSKANLEIIDGKAFTDEISKLNTTDLQMEVKAENINMGILKKEGTVITKYVDKEGNEIPGIEQETTTDSVGEPYTTTAKEIPGYRLIEEPSNKEGSYIEGTIEVIYKYVKLSEIKTQIEVNKIWEDNNNVNEKRPTSVILILKQGNKEIARQEVSEGTNWKYTFQDIAQYDEEGNEIKYTVDEEEKNTGDLKFYTKKIEGKTITNTFTVPDEKISITVNKVWNDNNNEAQKRPESVIIILKQGKQEIARQEVTEEMNWSNTFTNLAKYDSQGNEIKYTLEEQETKEGDLKFYETTIEGNTITNTFIVPEDTVEIQVTKKWEDQNNIGKTRPESIVLVVKNGESEVATQEVTEEMEWKYTFKNLPKYDGMGNQITYEIDEKQETDEKLDNYTKTIDVQTKTITNTVIKIPAKIRVEHIDKINNKLLQTEEIEGEHGEEYETSAKTFEGYVLQEKPEQETVVMQAGEETIVRYYYVRKAKVIVEYVEKETNTKVAEDETIEGYEQEDYITKAKEINGYKMVEVTDNYKGKMKITEEKQEDGSIKINNTIKVTYYYEKGKFDLQLDKWLSEVEIDGKRKQAQTIEEAKKMYKVEIYRKDTQKAEVKLIYKIRITNKGEIAGKTTKITEQIPEGYILKQEDNTIKWEKEGDRTYTAQIEGKELQAGEYEEIEVVLRWENGDENFGVKVNTAQIAEYTNEVGAKDYNEEDNKATNQMMIAIETGANTQIIFVICSYITVIGGMLLIYKLLK